MTNDKKTITLLNGRPIAQKIKEGIFESMDQNGCSLPTKAVEEIAHRKAKELSVPVSSPSDLIVEVDGEKKGVVIEILEGDEYEAIYVVGMVLGKCDFSELNHHIRLLTKDGGCVMDNRKH